MTSHIKIFSFFNLFRNIKNISILFFLFTINGVVFAQNFDKDSLQIALTKPQPIKERINTLFYLCQKIGTDKVLYYKYANEALQLSEKLKLKSGIALGHVFIGNYFSFFNENNLEGIKQYHIALKLYEELEDDTNILYCYVCLADTYYDLFNFQKALEYNTKGYELATQKQVNHFISMFSFNIGNILCEMNLPKKASKYFQSCYSAAKKVPNDNLLYLGYSYSGFAIEKSIMGDYDKALPLFYKAQKTLNIAKDSTYNSINYYYLGDLYKKTNQIDSSIVNFKKSLNFKYNEPIFLKLKLDTYNALEEAYLLKDINQSNKYKALAHQLKERIILNLDEKEIIQLTFDEHERQNKINLLKQNKKEKSILKFNFYNIIILMGILQGILFGLIIFLNKKYNKKINRYLAYTVLSLSLSNLQYWFIDSKIAHLFTFLSVIRIPFELLILPMFYFFVNAYLEIKLSRKTKIMLLVPFTVDLILQIFLTINQYFFKQKINEIYFYFEEFFSFAFTAYLIIVIIRIVYKYEKENIQFNIHKVKAETKWIKQLLFIGLLTCVFWIAVLFYMKAYNDVSIYYGLWISISIIVYWISYVGLFQSAVLFERINIRNDHTPKAVDLAFKSNKKENEKLIEDFIIYANQCYNNPNLKVEDIALKMGISTSYLSQILGSNQIRFNQFINQIRIEKVKQILKNDDFKNYTITSVGLEAGFNSNASFYRAFKKTTGISPIEYKEMDN